MQRFLSLVIREDTVPQQSRENSILALLESSQNKKTGERERFVSLIRSFLTLSDLLPSKRTVNER